MPIFCASAQKNDFKAMNSLNSHFAKSVSNLTCMERFRDSLIQ